MIEGKVSSFSKRQPSTAQVVHQGWLANSSPMVKYNYLFLDTENQNIDNIFNLYQLTTI